MGRDWTSGRRVVLPVALALAIAAALLLDRDDAGERAASDRAAADAAPERVTTTEGMERTPQPPKEPEDLNEKVRQAYLSQPKLAGRVVDRHRRGVPGVRVAVSHGGSRNRREVATDADGRFEFDLRGKGDLAFTHYRGLRRTADNHPQVESVGAGVELLFEGLAGHVIAEDDTPIERGVVLARRPGGDEILANAPLDTRGAFAFHGLDPGSYRLSYKTSHHGSEYETVEGGLQVESWQTDVVLRLAAGETIEGIVFDEKGAPRQGIWIRATFGETTLTGAYSIDEGHFTIKGLVPGRTYLLTSWMRGYVPERREAVAGERDVRFELDPGLSSDGRLLDAQDKAITGRQVIFRTADGFDLPAYATTDGKGRFEVGGLPDEPIEARVVIGTIRSCGSFQAGLRDLVLRPETE